MRRDRKSTRLNSSHVEISYAVFCLKKKTTVALAGSVIYAVSSDEHKKKFLAPVCAGDVRSTLAVLEASASWDLADVNFFFFNDTATTEIYTLSLHDALPIDLRRSMNAQSISGGGGSGTVIAWS